MTDTAPVNPPSPEQITQDVVNLVLAELEPLVSKLAGSVPTKAAHAFRGLITAFQITTFRLLAAGVEENVPEGERKQAFDHFKAVIADLSVPTLEQLHPWLKELATPKKKLILVPGVS